MRRAAQPNRWDAFGGIQSPSPQSSPSRARKRWAAACFLVSALWLAVGCGSSGGGQAASAVVPVQGYVVSSFGYVYPVHAGAACPDGFTRGAIERRLDGDPPLPDDCDDPEAHSDPEFKTLQAAGWFSGIDLDGMHSTAAAPLAGECGHDDFNGPDSETGLDYQLWRAIGCIRGFQQGEIADIVVGGAVREGSMTILLEVSDMDDETDDDQVSVRAFASTEAPPTGSDGDLLPFATLTAHADERYHSTVGTGSMVDGVITAGPMDLRLRLNIQIVAGDLTFTDAYIRMEKRSDGSVEGVILGYQEIGEVYEIFGRQAGRAGAEALSYTCTGLWSALRSQADGGFDAATGSCSSISVAYRFEAIPAFVVQ